MAEARWIGQINGSRYGNLFWTEDENGDGELSVGQADGNVLKLKSSRRADDPNAYDLNSPVPQTAAQSGPLGRMDVEDASQGHRAGRWKLNDGSAGTFEVLIKKFGSGSASPNPLEQSQVQIANKEVPLGAITLYRADLDRIIAELGTYFEEPFVPVIRAKEGDQVIVRNAVEYLARRDLPEKVKELTIAIEKEASHGLKKIVTLVLSDDLDSKIFVSSPDELWTEAVAQRLNRYLQEFTSTFTGFLRRHGLNVNSFMLVVLLIALPEFNLVDRIVVALLTLILMLIVVRSHKLVPFARIYLDPDRARKPYAKELPSVILGLLSALTISALTALPKIADWVSHAAQALWKALG